MQVSDTLGTTIKKRKIKRAYYEKKPEIASIDFAASSVPMHALGNSDPVDEDFLELVRQKFEERPIWSKRALEAQFTEASQVAALRSVMPHVAYTFTSGPWRTLYIRLGFDPRTRQNRAMSAKYQSIDFRYPRKYRDFTVGKNKTFGLEHRQVPHRMHDTVAQEMYVYYNIYSI